MFRYQLTDRQEADMYEKAFCIAVRMIAKEREQDPMKRIDLYSQIKVEILNESIEDTNMMYRALGYPLITIVK